MFEADFAASLDAIARLVSGFREHVVALREPQTSEAVVRQEYIDPFWIALGWDVANREHRSPAEKDIVIEAPVATLEAEKMRSRRPDYLFRVGGFPRFVVEAKKPVVDIAVDKESIFQAKTYAWSAQIPFAVLTDFEEFRVFDATVKPYFHEPNRGLIEEFSLRYEDYVGQWDIVQRTFGRQAVIDGSLEALLARIKKLRGGRRVRGTDRMLFDLRGTEPVDRIFLSHLEDYRLRLSRAIYGENRPHFPEADSRHGAARLTEAAQRLIDRIVFLRVCEDRGVTSYGGVRDVLDQASSEGHDLYGALVSRFREFDSTYNGYLFKAHFSEQLLIPADVLGDFIRSLYMPEGPYRFDAIGDDLLGIIYERFLGSAIVVAKGRVTAEEKPEVRHAGGVYYSPRFVVDTIIRRVVGPQIEGKSPDDLLDVKILDPACGSGSFLIAAYQFLIDYCTKYFEEHPEAAAEHIRGKNGKKQRFDRAFRERDGQWHLAPDFRTRLLTSCIFGVDIDAQAVEVSIMSLYLKALEGKLPANWQKKWVDERLLPPLDNNVLCGNSLLSQTDFDTYWDKKHGNLFAGDDDVRFRINAFDWNSYTQGFGRLFAERRGFDCIVGNPPYIRVQELNKWAPDECEFYKSRYRSAAKGNFDIYVVFIERCLELLGENGLLGVISPHKYWQAAYGAGLRQLIAEGKHLRSIIDFTDQQVFRGVTTYTAIQVLQKQPKRGKVDFAEVTHLQDGETQCETIDRKRRCAGVHSFTTTQPVASTAWTFHASPAARLAASVRDSGVPLAQVASRLFVGLQTSADDVFILEKDRERYRSAALSAAVELEEELLHPLLKGSVHMRRWLPDETSQVVLFPYENDDGRWRLVPEKTMKVTYPESWKYLVRCRERLRKRERGTFGGDRWYGYVYPKNLGEMSSQKLLTPSLARRSEFSYDVTGQYYFVGSGGGGGGGYGITLNEGVSPHYMLGLLNSRLLDWWIRLHSSRFHSGWYAFNKQYIAQVPIKIAKKAGEQRLAAKVIERVERILSVKDRLLSHTLADRSRVQLARELESHEQAIDKLVMQLYGVDEIPED